MSNSPAAATSAAKAPQEVMRRKKEVTMFSKNPSKPFALAALQKAKGITPLTSSGSFSSTSGLKPARSTPRPLPSSRSNQSLASSSSTATVKASGSTTSVGASPSKTAKPNEPELPFQEFSIVSTDRHGWRYDVMKFDSRKPVDINSWQKPVKLNRKDLRRPDPNASSGTATPVAVGPMLGPDGKPVIGADGRIVMVDAEGKPIHEAPPSSSGSAAASTKKDDKGKRKKFQKKTRQVFLVPDHIRQLRREERYPWIMEDASGSEIWEGRMEDASKAEMHGLLMPAPNNVFKFVPANRWYKFQKKLPQKQHMTLEEAERKMAERQKGKDLGRWGSRSGTAPMAGGMGGPSLVHDYGGQSLAPGGRRLRTVDSGMRGLFDDDDDDGGRGRRMRERELGGEGDMDEMEYEEDFADDEEPLAQDGMGDEEAKELEERLKREYKSANKTREGYIDESEEEDEDELTGAGKDMKKLMKKIEKNAAYESDEEKNPYASSEDEEEEEEQPPQPTGPAVQEQPNVKKPTAAGGVQQGGSKAPSQAGSRSSSPAPTGPAATAVKVKTEGSPPPTSPILGMGGHSVLAKRATSPPLPKAPKLKASLSGSRATSPLASAVASRAGSPTPPVLSPGASRATSPTAVPSKKRKAEDGSSPVINGAAPSATNVNGNSAQPKLKKRKPAAAPSTPSTPSPAVSLPPASGEMIDPGTELSTEVLVRVLKARPGMKTRECIKYFQPILTEEKIKHRFTELVKEVANLKDGVLVLKALYREGGAEA